MSYIVVLSTASNLKEARKLANLLIQKHLAACINILPHLESHYRWKNKKQTSKEVLLIIKTKKSVFKLLEQTIKKNHSYSVPEIISIPIIAGNKNYLSWLNGEVRSGRS